MLDRQQVAVGECDLAAALERVGALGQPIVGLAVVFLDPLEAAVGDGDGVFVDGFSAEMGSLLEFAGLDLGDPFFVRGGFVARRFGEALSVAGFGLEARRFRLEVRDALFEIGDGFDEAVAVGLELRDAIVLALEFGLEFCEALVEVLEVGSREIGSGVLGSSVISWRVVGCRGVRLGVGWRWHCCSGERSSWRAIPRGR